MHAGPLLVPSEGTVADGVAGGEGDICPGFAVRQALTGDRLGFESHILPGVTGQTPVCLKVTLN